MTRRSSPRLAQVSLSSPPAAAGRTAGRRPTSGPRPARRPRGAGSRRRTRPPQPRHTRPRAARRRPAAGRRRRPARSQTGRPTQALVEESAEASSLVVVCRGRGSVLATLLGSVSFAVASSAPCPVVVVKDGLAATVVGPKNRVVVGTDGSERAASAVAFAADFAASRSASMDVICCTGEL